MISTRDVEKAVQTLWADIDELKAMGSKRIQQQLEEMADHLDALEEAVKGTAAREREEELRERNDYDLRHRRLRGFAEEISILAHKRPESPCNSFKIRQANQVLFPLQEELGAFMMEDLPLIDEQEKLSYSDVSLLVRSYLDISMVYARLTYGLNYND